MESSICSRFVVTIRQTSIDMYLLHRYHDTLNNILFQIPQILGDICRNTHLSAVKFNIDIEPQPSQGCVHFGLSSLITDQLHVMDGFRNV
ncbi:hypothetical protein VFPPC_16308 [Pochonia chlamydosporia 170]|uniref:Uncharacterized protein n=1 Tax=Pochonia chlamydosporia 170 TaxID=1380566 RepID=A0A179FHL3_METCM|nr:hypothetical protein VFPPC_16308 [Pochonia chlamydosporia 170]OAQ65115.1 hypothetical protein VFPPC_16308 [Pochonia chlamydosporia 170]